MKLRNSKYIIINRETRQPCGKISTKYIDKWLDAFYDNMDHDDPRHADKYAPLNEEAKHILSQRIGKKVLEAYVDYSRVIVSVERNAR